MTETKKGNYRLTSISYHILFYQVFILNRSTSSNHQAIIPRIYLLAVMNILFVQGTPHQLEELKLGRGLHTRSNDK